ALAASSRVRSLGQEAGPAEDLASEYSGSFMGFVEDTVEADSEVPDLGEYHIWFAGSPKSKTGSAHLQSLAASEAGLMLHTISYDGSEASGIRPDRMKGPGGF
ncbi:unnamed protein product, partial [Polarella glacialis]